jgi:hypothetical protein
MKKAQLLKASILAIALTFFLSCGKEEATPIDNRIVGEWTIYSFTDEANATIIWDELEASLVDLIPEYSCLSYTLSVNAKLATESFVNIDVESRGCLSPALTIFTWAIDPETDLYDFTQGAKFITNLVTYSNNDNRMRWTNQKSGEVKVWDRIVAETSSD